MWKATIYFCKAWDYLIRVAINHHRIIRKQRTTYTLYNRIFVNLGKCRDCIKNNMSGMERRALTELFNDKQIPIKPSIKGRALVVMDTDQYILEKNR